MTRLKGTKRKILCTSIKLFKNKGFGSVSVKDICDASNITRSTFYYHYDSKESILDDYFVLPADIINDKITEILSSTNSIESFFVILNTFLDQIIDSGHDIIKQLFKRNIDTNIRQFEPMEIDLWEIYLNILKKAKAEKRIKNKSPLNDLLKAYLYMSDGIILVWCSSSGKVDLKEEQRKLFYTIFEIDDRDN